MATGFGEMMGNKGGLKVSFNLAETSLLFVNCHLHSGLESVAKRGEDVKNIMDKLVDPWKKALKEATKKN